MLQLCPSCVWEDGCPFGTAHTYNCWNYEPREDACYTDCADYARGTCPYDHNKQDCERYRLITLSNNDHDKTN